MRNLVKYLIAGVIGIPFLVFMQGALLLMSPFAIPLWYLCCLGTWAHGGEFNPADPWKCLFFPVVMFKDLFLGIES